MTQEDTQFKKGNTKSVGNKGGRPKGKSMQKILKHMLKGTMFVQDDVVVNKKGEVTRELTTKEVLALKLVTIGLEGEDADAMRSILAIIDRVDGKVTDKVEQKNIDPYTEADYKRLEEHDQRQKEAYHKQQMKNMSAEEVQAIIKEREDKENDRTD